jgi:Fe-S cluster biogenesis protein NfuA
MDKLKKVLDKIRPALQADGGDVELVKYDEKTGVVELALTGACHGCPMAGFTLKNLIEAEIKKELPEVKEVKTV